MRKEYIYIIGIIVFSFLIIFEWSNLANIIIRILDIQNTVNNHQIIKKTLFILNTIIICLVWLKIRHSNKIFKIIYIIIFSFWILIMLMHFVLIGTPL